MDNILGCKSAKGTYEKKINSTVISYLSVTSIFASNHFVASKSYKSEFKRSAEKIILLIKC